MTARLIVIMLIAAIPTTVFARCQHPPIPWRFGSSISSTWHITEGSSCGSTSNHPENIAKIEIETRARNGIAGKSGPYVIAYKPNAGFKGTDTFSFVITSNANLRSGAGLVAHVTVYVISE